MTGPDKDRYWLLRFAQAIENAIDAPGERSRGAFFDLADHYWSMHVLVHGRTGSARISPLAVRAAATPSDSRPPLRWAA